jgi:hypothetical protein
MLFPFRKLGTEVSTNIYVTARYRNFNTKNVLLGETNPGTLPMFVSKIGYKGAQKNMAHRRTKKMFTISHFMNILIA